MAGPFALEFLEGGIWFNGKSGGCYFEDDNIALDRAFWVSLDASLRKRARGSNGWLPMAQSYFEARLMGRDLRAFWERTMDIPLERSETTAPIPLYRLRRGPRRAHPSTKSRSRLHHQPRS